MTLPLMRRRSDGEEPITSPVLREGSSSKTRGSSSERHGHTSRHGCRRSSESTTLVLGVCAMSHVCQKAHLASLLDRMCAISSRLRVQWLDERVLFSPPEGWP